MATVFVLTQSSEKSFQMDGEVYQNTDIVGVYQRRQDAVFEMKTLAREHELSIYYFDIEEHDFQ